MSQVDIESRVLHFFRLKKGLSTTHPLRPDEIKAIKPWLMIRAKMKVDTDDFFLSNRRGALSRKTAWLAIRNYVMLKRVVAEKEFPFESLIPNVETIENIKAARRGKLTTAASLDGLFKDLNVDD